MAVSHQGVFVQTPKIAQTFATHGNTTTPVTLYTSPTSGSGSKVVAIFAATTLASNRIVQISRAGNLLGSQTLSANAGNDGVTASANLLALIPGLPRDNDGQPYFFLVAADTLQCAVTVAVTTNKKVQYTAIIGDF